MLSVSKAQKQILDSLSPLKNETIKLEDALNRILAEPVIADQDSPSFDNSSMDGIAVIAADIEQASPKNPVHLSLIGTIPAGQKSGLTIQPGQAIQIMTGAPMPAGADCVVQVEHTNLDFSTIKMVENALVFHPSEQGGNIRKQGEFFSQGDILIPAGKKILPQDLAILAMTGMAELQVVQRPRIGLLTSGDELVPPGEPLPAGKIRDTNSYMLTALLKNANAEVISTGIIPDDNQQVLQALTSLRDSGVDIILTSGGVSMGAYDIIRNVIEEHGNLKLWRVNMRPGKPLAFGDFQGTHFIGLPGNPVSAFVGFFVFVRPALKKLVTGNSPPIKTQKAVLLEPVHSDGRESYIPAKMKTLDGEAVVQPAQNLSSGNLYALIPGNSLIILPVGVKFLNKGEIVEVVKLNLD